MRIATFNIRYDWKPDNISVRQSLDAFLNRDPLKEVAFHTLKGEQPWSARRIHVASHILDEGAVLAGQLLLLSKITETEVRPDKYLDSFSRGFIPPSDRSC